MTLKTLNLLAELLSTLVNKCKILYHVELNEIYNYFDMKHKIRNLFFLHI